jgi:hypothetical protein
MHKLLLLISALAVAAGVVGGVAVWRQQDEALLGIVDGVPPATWAERPADTWAVNIELARYSETELARAFGHLESFGWLRVPVRWSQVEPEQGRFEWRALDRALPAAHAAGFRVWAVLVDVPEWAASTSLGANSPVFSPAQFGEFAAAVAARYATQVDAYEVWDEPNLEAAWGGLRPSPTEYTALLAASYPRLKTLDPSATVLAASLAPTVETGPDNVSDLIYLQALYDLDADHYFDAAAGKPYGFASGPDVRTADAQILNVARFAELRAVMARNGDADAQLWGGNFGWNVLPASPWGTVDPATQVDFSEGLYRRAEQEWAWSGPIALEAYQPLGVTAPPASDPHWGFALADPSGALTALGRDLARGTRALQPGRYGVEHPAMAYTGGWQFSALGGDIPEVYETAVITATFEGSELTLRVRRGDYRAHLYITVDGQPANALPADATSAYLNLTSPTLETEVVDVPVAHGLEPDAMHVAVIRPQRGWDQWAIVGFAVGRRAPDGGLAGALGVAVGLVSAGLFGLVVSLRRLSWAWVAQARVRPAALVTLATGVLMYLSTWLSWEGPVTAVSRRLGDAPALLLTALTAGVFYFSPSVWLALLALLALGVLFFLRPQSGLALVAGVLPFYLFPRMLWDRGASLFEFLLWLLLAATLARKVVTASADHGPRTAVRGRLPWIDAAVLALLIVGAVSTLLAEQRVVAVYEFRTVFVSAAVLYAVTRLIDLDRAAMWCVVDVFVLGAVVVAGCGLYQLVTSDGSGLITTAEGVARIRSVYGSPNNLALYLGRALPIALAVALLARGASGWRRVAYGGAGLVLLTAMVLTFSRGALVLGLPAALAVLVIGWQGRRGWVVVGAALAFGLLAIPLLLQIPRFAGMFDFDSGTGFFRVNLWHSAVEMARDHLWFGVGPDNFLYAYRGVYIRPEAWQEPNLSHPHNLVLDALTRIGLPGLIALGALIVGYWRTGLRAVHANTGPERALAIGLLAAGAHMLAHGLVDHSFFLVDLAGVFMLLLALAGKLAVRHGG